ncbi:MAG: hypothetical protein CMN57_13015 [Gammaproteobacteria bacterium]|nr:hypothetical protein [Gammaproteobacteria bacterium]
MKKTIMRIVMGTTLITASAAQAVTISLDQASTTSVAGSNFSLDVLADFSSTEIIQGSVEFNFDSNLLSYTGFSWNSDFLSLLALAELEIESSDTVSIGFGVGITDDPLTGPGHTIGTISFDALATGSTSVNMAVSSFHGGYLDPDLNIVTASFNNASVDISAVPVPAAVWLFGSGLIGLAGIARRRA